MNTDNRSPRTRCRPASCRAFSLIEMVIALAVTSLLGLIMVSAIMIVTRSVDSHLRGADGRTDEAARLTDQLTEELRTALRISEPLRADQIDFTIPDQDNDEQPDRIQYMWSGSPDFTLTRTAFLSDEDPAGTPVIVATDVRAFDLRYVTRDWGSEPPLVFLESDEMLLVAHDDRPGEHGTQIVFVVTNVGGPSVGELVRQGLMQWWGFTVVLLDDDASPTEFEDAASLADAVYVSVNVDAVKVGDKLNDVTIGVVSEHPELMDELGFASGGVAAGPQSLLEVDQLTHYLTSVFRPGLQPVFESSQAVMTIDTAVDAAAPGLNVLGSWASAPALATLEVGAELYAAGAGPATFGEATPHPSRTIYSEFKDDCVATKATLDTAAVVSSMAAYLDLKKNGKKVRFAIYADNAGEPGARLGESDTIEFDAGVSWRTIEFDEPLILPAGVYWLSAAVQSDVAYFFDHSGGQSRFADPPGNPTDGFPAAWTDTYGPDPNVRRFSIYANYTTARLATGRRVALPWGATGFDASALTSDGETLMKRALQWAADTSPGDHAEPFFVLKNEWAAQYFLPELPVNATGWSITRVFVAIRADERDPGGKVIFEVRHAAPGSKPADEVLATTGEIEVSGWSDRQYEWYQVPLPTVADLNPENGACLVIRGRRNENAIVQLDRIVGASTSGTHFMSTIDEGDTWSSPNEIDDLRVYVCGTYTTSGEPVWP